MATYGDSTESTFPEADVDKALNPALNRKFEVDPVSSDISTTKDIQQEQDEAAHKKEREKKDALQKLKTTHLCFSNHRCCCRGCICHNQKIEREMKSLAR
ncbi:hypothetical protein OIU84_026200 [Salix udensis]|uniref:Uncharacterized protein n=1 Tax=Salix udensis TaxID=889485 RepID=A0AAD6PDJ0_9ROSI|nr:hypothetical protein OIU84_026200 [Salix udensis]